MTEFLYILALVVANVIQGITGFAGNILSMPPAAILLGVDTARGALNLLSLISGVVMVVWFHKHIVWREFAKIVAFMMPGIIVGIWIYSCFPSNALLTPYGAVVAAIGVWYLVGRRETPIPRAIMALLVLASGLMQGMFVSGGPLLVVYAVTVLRDKEDFRATLAVIWLALNIIIFAQSLVAGMVTPSVVHYTLVGIIPIVAATIIGGRLQKRFDQSAFLKLTYVLLIVSGIMLVAKTMM